MPSSPCFECVTRGTPGVGQRVPHRAVRRCSEAGAGMLVTRTGRALPWRRTPGGRRWSWRASASRWGNAATLRHYPLRACAGPVLRVAAPTCCSGRWTTARRPRSKRWRTPRAKAARVGPDTASTQDPRTPVLRQGGDALRPRTASIPARWVFRCRPRGPGRGARIRRPRVPAHLGRRA